MKCYPFVRSLAMAAVLCFPAFAQVDEVGDATGLPIPIGAPVIYGQVTFAGAPRNERKPFVQVTLWENGVQIDRRQTNPSGYYYFLKRPLNGYVLTFEIEGRELGRVVLATGISNRHRQDVTVDWQTLKGTTTHITGSASAKDRYERSPDAEKMFDRAMAAYKEKNDGEAIRLFREMVSADEKDFLAWTVLGTIYISQKKFDEAAVAFESALAANPEFSLALINLGKTEIGLKQFDKAISILTKAVQANAHSADANHWLGEAYLQAKKGSVAVGYLNRAIELAPVEKAEIHLRLAALYNAAGLKDRAAEEYKQFLSKVTEHPDKKSFEKYIKENSKN